MTFKRKGKQEFPLIILVVFVGFTCNKPTTWVVPVKPDVTLGSPSTNLSLWTNDSACYCLLTYYILVFPSSSPFYRCLSSLLPSRCSVVWADVCPGCWTRTSTSSPSLNSLVMCMLLQLTSSLSIFLWFLHRHNSQHPPTHTFSISLVREVASLCCHLSLLLLL